MKIAFHHPNPSLQSPWNCAQLGLLIFPLSPFLGAVGLGLALLTTWWRQYRKIIRRRVNWGFALLGLLLIVSACFAVDKKEAFPGLFNFLPFFLFFAAFGTLIQTTAQLRQLSWIMAIGSVPIMIVGFGQLFFGWTSKLEVLWIVLELNIAKGGDPPGRMASIFMHANTLAGYLMIVFILALGLWLEQWREIRNSGLGIRDWRFGYGAKIFAQYPVASRQSLVPFLFLTMVAIANFTALILTNSRNAWAIAIFACLAYAVYQGWRILVAGVAGVITSVLLAAYAPTPVAQLFRKFVPAFFWARLNDQLYPDRPVALMRKTQWQFAWSLTQQRPWTGWGIRNFTAIYKAQTQIRLGHPHNLFLMLSSETGLVSTLLFCGLISWIFIGAVQLLKSKNLPTEDRLLFFSYFVVFVGWLLFNTVDVSLFDFRLNTLSWLLLSAITGVVYRYNPRQPASG